MINEQMIQRTHNSHHIVKIITLFDIIAGLTCNSTCDQKMSVAPFKKVVRKVVLKYLKSKLL